MEPESPPPSSENLIARREFVRRSVLRANRAVAVILLAVVLLAVTLVLLVQRSRQNQARAERAEAEETERLWRASLAQARAENKSPVKGHREAARQAVATAAAIRPSVALRNEAIAALFQRDLEDEREWPLLPGAYGYSFDPDLAHYVVRYDETKLSMFRVADNAFVRDFPMPPAPILPRGSNVGDFVFSATGKYVAIRYNGGAATVWERDTGKLRHLIGREPRTAKFSWPPTFSADDRTMCLATEGSDGFKLLWDLDAGGGRGLPDLPPEAKYTGYDNRFRLSPRGDRLAFFSGSTVTILDAATGAAIQTLSGPAIVQAVAWDPAGRQLSFNCDNFTLFVWDETTNRVRQMGGSLLLPWVQQFSADGRLLLTGGTDGITRLWDVPFARLICQTSSARGLVISRDAQRIGWGIDGKKVGVWRITQPAALQFVQGTVIQRASSWRQDLDEGGRFAMLSPPGWTQRHAIELIDLGSGGRSRFFPLPASVASGFRPGHPQLWFIEADTLKLADLPREALPDWGSLAAGVTQSLPLPDESRTYGAAFCADGRHAVVSGAGGALHVIDTEKPGEFVRLEGSFSGNVSMPGPASPTGSGVLAFSPDARWVAAGRFLSGWNPAVWDAQTGELVARLPTRTAHLAFSPDGKWLATVGSAEGQLWSTGDWQLQMTRPRPVLLANEGAVAFSGDGSLCAWTRSTTEVELLSGGSGDVLAEVDLGFLGFVQGLRLAADGSRLFATGAEGRMAALEIAELRRELDQLGLDWGAEAERPATAAAAATSGEPPGFSAWSPALLGLAAAGVAAGFGVLVLRRQGRLTHEFFEATEVAAQREKELAAEREIGDLKSRFVSTVSHEFRTPLGVTMSAVELLRHYEEQLPKEERAQLFEDIFGATRNMAELMEQVLVLGRVDAGKLAYKPAPLDLDALCAKLSDELLSATNRKCPIEFAAQNDLSGARADESLLRLALTNLLSNGVKYSADGGTVEFAARREGRHAVFQIRDHGIGIPAADLPQLFEAFHRGGNAAHIAGTGLGLVIVKRCVELHGGMIEVASEEGKGTTFSVRVPAW